MSKTKEELWSRFLVTNYEGKYLEESDTLNLIDTYYDFKKIFRTLEMDGNSAGMDLVEVKIKNPGNVLRKLGNKTGNKPFDSKATYGGKQATLWRVAGTYDDTNYELIFAKTSELLSGSGWVGNFWLVDGYFFSFSEGFSTMAAVLFKKDDQDRPIMQILLGEQAYEAYQEKIQQHQWDAINRRLI